jgi:hypothetical protein
LGATADSGAVRRVGAYATGLAMVPATMEEEQGRGDRLGRTKEVRVEFRGVGVVRARAGDDPSA